MSEPTTAAGRRFAAMMGAPDMQTHVAYILAIEAEARAAALDEARAAVEALSITAPSDLSRESLDLRDGFDWHKHEALAAIDALREDADAS